MPNCPPPPPTIQIRQKLNNIEQPKCITRHLHGSMNSLNSLPNPASISLCGNVSDSAWDLGSKQTTKHCDFLDSFGRGGAGAPIRDRYGRLVTDRGALRQSWHTMLDTNLPHSLNNSLNSSDNGYNDLNRDGSVRSGTTTTDHNGNYVGENMLYGGKGNELAAPVLDRRQSYKMELKRQIEENKRLKTLELQRERERDAREQALNRDYMERQKRELEEEKRREAKRYGHAQDWDVETKLKNVGGKSLKRDVQEDKNEELEWWEKKPPVVLADGSVRTSRGVNKVAQVKPIRSTTSVDRLHVGRPLSKIGAESPTSFSQSPRTPAPIRSPTIDEAESFAPLGYDRQSLVSGRSSRKSQMIAPAALKKVLHDNAAQKHLPDFDDIMIDNDDNGDLEEEADASNITMS
uniref:Uncharacterized protein n=1 Tax=Romanomermis culicivorax TaxID=13658 RepID=A0A915IHP0_ROMCU